MLNWDDTSLTYSKCTNERGNLVGSVQYDRTYGWWVAAYKGKIQRACLDKGFAQFSVEQQYDQEHKLLSDESDGPQ